MNASTAAMAAATAAQVARDVANTAAETAAEVAETAQKTAESVLLFSQDLSYIKADISEIKSDLKHMAEQYATKADVTRLVEDKEKAHVAIQRLIEEGHIEAHDSFVTKDNFTPVQRIVYGMVTLILVAVIGSIVALVLIK